MSRVADGGDVEAATGPRLPASRGNRPRPDRSRLSRGRLVANDCRASQGRQGSSGAAIGGRGQEAQIPHPDRPPHRGRENCPELPPGARENFLGGAGGEVVAEAAVPGRADRPILAVHRIPAVARARADIAGGAEFAGIEWTGGALA